jgi:hypothetical protein|nr:MAG TPA: PROTEIN/RNA Complex, archaeal, ribosomal, 50S, protein.0A [Bacteriophage sp.]
MAKEYIEREEAIEAIRAYKGYFQDQISTENMMLKLEAENVINDLETADVAPVRHGRLVSTGYDELYCEFGDCTICGADNPISSRYCRQCGAKMDLEG